MKPIFVVALSGFVGLAACDGENPFQNIVDDPGVTPPVVDPDNPLDANGIPVSLSQNLQAVNYVPGTTGPGTLSVDMFALDQADNPTSDIPLANYVPNANLTALAPGYEVFSYQDDAADRMFVAIVAQSTDGSVTGAVVMDGGQFIKFFGGGFYSNGGNYTPGNPANDTGLVSYAGTYASLTNLPGDGTELLDPTRPIDDAISPGQPAQISGDIFLNADFNDNSVNGAIYNRAFTNLDPLITAAIGGNDLPDVFLIPADITSTGTFFGDAQNPAQETVGEFGGTFGGIEAAAVGGTVQLDGDWLPGVENEEEFGVFVLTQCGQPLDDPICDNIPVNPNP